MWQARPAAREDYSGVPGDLINFLIPPAGPSAHGPERWYRHDYSKDELANWANRIRASGAKGAWIYFNNDSDAHAPKIRVGMLGHAPL